MTNKFYVGIGKTKFNSSVATLREGDHLFDTELYLTERFNRKKCSGAFPFEVIKKSGILTIDQLVIGENKDVHCPREIEDLENKFYPLYEYIEKNNFTKFFSHFNPEVEFVSHHLSHAKAAHAMSPFEKSIIVVIDGAGNSNFDLGITKQGLEKKHEECSIFLQDKQEIKLVHKNWVQFKKSKKHISHTFGDQIGAFYEKISEYIFNSPHSSGKVMGLAPFGQREKFNEFDLYSIQENLDWSLAFLEKSKKSWEASLNLKHYEDLASKTQSLFEDKFESIFNEIRKNYPDYENVIISGGCALNCTFNAKLYYSKLFSKIYIPPFPGDESIGFGIVNYLKDKDSPERWKALPFKDQSGYFGPKSSIPTEELVIDTFKDEDFEIIRPADLLSSTAELLSDKKIIAWFQGRSESGPRALGNRSILARPDVSGLKDYLNLKIKFRESFRPYGCSVLYEEASRYFEVEDGFNNPYMSFAVRIRNEYKELLKEVGHIDGTSRMQTVRAGQNEKFYNLIKAFGKKTGLFCLLNTSLNVMDEPIVETVQDAKRFLLKTPVDALVIGDFIIKKTN